MYSYEDRSNGRALYQAQQTCQADYRHLGYPRVSGVYDFSLICSEFLTPPTRKNHRPVFMTLIAQNNSPIRKHLRT